MALTAANAWACLLVTLPWAVLADAGSARLTIDRFDDCARDRFLRVGTNGASVRLVHSWLLATEDGITSKHPQFLSASNQIRKVFDIPLPDCERAVLCIFHGGGSSNKPMRIESNGRTLLHGGANAAARRGWEYEPVPADWLSKGPHEVVFSGAGNVPLDTRSANRGSAVSYDAGRSWHPAPGEYTVRLRLFGYPPEGILTSEVLDTAWDVAAQPSIGPWPRYERAALSYDADVPRGTEIVFAWRAGSTRRFDPATWTPWRAGIEAGLAGNRFLQWRAVLKTRSAAKTPCLRRVVVDLFPAAPSEQRTERSGLRVIRWDAPRRESSSYEFIYEGPTPRVLYLAEKYKLASIPPAGASDLARTSAIRYWCSHQWNKGWDWGRYKYVPPWDALILLDMAPPNLCLGMCTHYSTLYVQTSVALGYVSRHVILDYHCIAETYLNDRGKWVVQDAGPGPGPKGYPIGVRFEANGEPLNALDLRRLWRASGTAQAVPDRADGEPGEYGSKQTLWLYGRFGIALRNNHLSVPEPAEEEHGQDHYHYNGYLWWTDNPDEPEQGVWPFGLLSNREADFYAPVNDTWIDLEHKARRVLAAALSHNMPNFERHEVSVDGGEWKLSPAAFAWPLHAGTNTIAARSVNAFGVPGRPSTVTILAPPE